MHALENTVTGLINLLFISLLKIPWQMSVCEGDTYLSFFFFFGTKILRVLFLFDQNIFILLLKFSNLN